MRKSGAPDGAWSPFECTVPNRGRSALLAIAGFTFAAVPLILPGLVGWMAVLWLIISSGLALFGALFLVAAIAPERFLLGAAPSAGGFELRRPLRSRKIIRFDEIERIDAIAGGDGDRGDEISWRVHTRSGNVVLTPHMLHGSHLFDLLTARLTIDRVALVTAAKHEPSGIEHLWGRAFTIYEKRRARYVNRLDVDASGFTYTSFEQHSEGARWEDVERVLFYFGEPDFPDPISGLAPIAEWRFVCLPDHRSVHVPHIAKETPRLADWCVERLPGFARATLDEAATLTREGHWLLWHR